MSTSAQEVPTIRLVVDRFEAIQFKLMSTMDDIGRFCDDSSEGSFTNLLNIVLRFSDKYGLTVKEKGMLNEIISQIVQTKNDLARETILKNKSAVRDCETQLISHCIRVCDYVKETMRKNHHQTLRGPKPKLQKDLKLISNIEVEFLDIISTLIKIDSEIHANLVNASPTNADPNAKFLKLLGISSLVGGLEAQWNAWTKQIENHLGETHSKLSPDSDKILQLIKDVNSLLLKGTINEEIYCTIKNLQQITVKLGKTIAPSILNEARGEIEQW